MCPYFHSIIREMQNLKKKKRLQSPGQTDTGMRAHFTHEKITQPFRHKGNHYPNLGLRKLCRPMTLCFWMKTESWTCVYVCVCDLGNGKRHLSVLEGVPKRHIEGRSKEFGEVCAPQREQPALIRSLHHRPSPLWEDTGGGFFKYFHHEARTLRAATHPLSTNSPSHQWITFPIQHVPGQRVFWLWHRHKTEK